MNASHTPHSSTSNALPRLLSWRAEPTRDPRLRFKLAVSLVLACSLALFGWALYQPLNQTRTYVLILTPDEPIEFSFDDAIDAVDVPQWMAAANAMRIQASVRDSHSASLIPSSGRSSLTQPLDTIRELLHKTLNRQSTLIVYASGVLATDRTEPALCECSRDATHSGNALRIIPLVQMLQSIECRRVLLCVDANTPRKILLKAPCSLAWKNVIDHVEAHLVDDKSTPLAVKLQLDSTELHQNQIATSEIATALCEMLSEHRREGIATLQPPNRSSENSIHEPSQSHQRSRVWMVSANWPFESHRDWPHRVSSVSHGRPLQNSEPKSQAVLEDANPKPPLDRDAEGFEAQLDLASVEQLLDFSEQIIDQWNLPKPAINCPLLCIPQPVNFRQFNPFAFHAITSLHAQLRCIQQLAPERLDRSFVHSFCRCLMHVDSGGPLPNDIPKWLQRLPNTMAQNFKKPSKSLTANATLGSLGLLPSHSLQSDVELLSQLVSLTMGSNSSRELASWLNTLSDHQKEFDEILWTEQVLSQPMLAWSLQRSLIQARLLSERIASDPLAREWSKESQLHADQERVTAERLVSDRHNSDWESIAEAKNREALVMYRTAIDQLARVRQRWLQYADLVTCSNPSRSRPVPLALKPLTDATGLVCDMEEQSDLLFQLLVPWNRSLAVKWVGGINSLKAKLSSVACSREEIVQVSNEYVQLHNTQIEILQEWITRHSSELPKQSHFWIFVEQHWNKQLDQLTNLVQSANDPTHAIVAMNLDRCRSELYGANTLDIQSIEQRVEQWAGLGTDLAISPLPCLSPSLGLTVDSKLNLAVDESSETKFQIVNASLSSPVMLEANFDAKDFSIQVDGLEIKNGVPIAVNQATQRMKHQLSVRRKRDLLNPYPILLQASQGASLRRGLIALDSPDRPMVSLEWHNTLCSIPKMDSQRRIAEANNNRMGSVLFANQVNSVALTLTNSLPTSTTLECHVLLGSNRGHKPPVGTVSKEVAKRWRDAVVDTVLVASAKPVTLSEGQSQTVVFPPSPWPPEQPPHAFDQLLVEIHNESQGTVQFEPWSPQVLHPRQYVQANVQYNEPQQSLSVSVGLTGHSPISKLGSKVEMHLMSLPNLEIVGSGTVLLSNGNQMQDRAQRMITTTNCKSSAAILCINVDGWKSAMLFDVDLSKSGACRASEGFAAIRIQSLETNNVVDKNQQDIAVQVDAIMNDDGFNPGRDAIHVGLDIASNRTLDDDAAFVLSRPCHIGFQWSGVDAHGNLAIRSNVEPHHVRLPLSLEWNRWVHAMAVLNRGSQQYFSNAIPIALDRIGPNIEAIRMLDKQPHQLGQPLRMEVKLTDDGLSGISVVEAGWSSTGELEFYEGMTIVPAVYRERDRWILNLPTDTLPSGRSLLLVRGRDRAGNIGETCSTAIEILSTTEIADRKSAMKSTIQGKVLFVSQPQNGIAVRLLANRDGNPAGTDPPLIASTVTNTEGGFMLREIPSGKYDLEATGIVRGMREKRTQQVIVEATNGPTQVQIRLDKRP